MSALVFFRPVLSLLPTSAFSCWHQREKIIADLKLLHPFLDSPLTDSQTDLYRESSTTLKFNVCFFFLDQHPMLLDRNGVHNRDGWKEGQCTRNRKLAAIICSWNIWRLWTTISAVEREQGLSLVDDWRHCCHCSWLKRRGATLMERGQVVFPARDYADVPFPLLKLNT